MNEPDAPQLASPEEEARITETSAVFANKVYVSPMPGGAKITFAERAGLGARTGRRRAWRCSCNTTISPFCAACSTGRRVQMRNRRPPAVRCTEPQGRFRPPRAHHMV